ncbi:putative peptidyl-prolyl cis-trans isomerase [compost metagenome]
MKPMTSLFLSLVALFFSCNNTTTTPPPSDKLGDGLYAEIETNKGKIVLQLEYQKTPLTVANFVSLAEGKNEMVSAEYKGKPFYDGLKWHRVIKNFMIQGGDPKGDGSGGPGYKFADEITDLKHDKPGILSMANAGKGTNGSQFFITHVPTPHLDGLHTVFGHTVQGMDVVNSIEQDDQIKSIKIVRIGKDAKKFNAEKVFKEYYEKAAAEQKKQAEALAKTKADKVAYFGDLKSKATKTASGLQYFVVKKGTGKKPANGAQVFLEYSGFLDNGSALLFDSSDAAVAKAFGNYIPQKDAAQAYKPIPFTAGTKTGMIAGFIEAIDLLSFGDKIVVFIPSHLGYGEKGYPRASIPGNADLIFELEMMETMPAGK